MRASPTHSQRHTRPMLLLATLLCACAKAPPGGRATRAAGASTSTSAAGAAGSAQQPAGDPSAAAPRDADVVTPATNTNAEMLLRTTPVAGSAAPAGEPERVPDDDGFSVADGDCDDFNPLVNPGAYDVAGNGVDEDCQGGDAAADSCDDGLEIAADDPLLAARAIELCAVATKDDRRWGVLAARWTTPDGKGQPGSPLNHGLLPNLGPSFEPRHGKRLLALSSGVARASGQPGATRSCSDELPARSPGLPADFDGKSSNCDYNDPSMSVVDAVALELRVRVPTNVAAISFDSAFFTDEYPDYICTSFNDFFQVIVEPRRPFGSKDGNVVFDQDANPVSVNNSLLRVCSPGEHGGKMFACPLGPSSLVGTGLDDCAPSTLLPGGLTGTAGGDRGYGASTGWLNTQLAVQPGEELMLRFTIWDSTDSSLDSVAIIDHVRFHLRSEPPPPEKPTTTPIGPS